MIIRHIAVLISLLAFFIDLPFVYADASQSPIRREKAPKHFDKIFQSESLRNDEPTFVDFDNGYSDTPWHLQDPQSHITGTRKSKELTLLYTLYAVRKIYQALEHVGWYPYSSHHYQSPFPTLYAKDKEATDWSSESGHDDFHTEELLGRRLIRRNPVISSMGVVANPSKQEAYHPSTGQNSPPSSGQNGPPSSGVPAAQRQTDELSLPQQQSQYRAYHPSMGQIGPPSSGAPAAERQTDELHLQASSPPPVPPKLPLEDGNNSPPPRIVIHPPSGTSNPPYPLTPPPRSNPPYPL